MGYADNSNFNRADFENHGFTGMRNVTYAESHDEERLMYKNLTSGATNGSYNVKDLNTALNRQKAIGAVQLAIPGPKMIWQFGELGYDFSINRCENGTISNDCRTSPKPVAFTLGYDTNANRKAIYDTWAKILQIKLGSQVFSSKTYSVESGNLLPKIYIWDDTLPSTTLKNVVILANFTLDSQNVVPYFPYTGTWYNLMDNSTMSVTNTAAPITIEAGGFRIFGNAAALATDENAVSKNEVSLIVTQNPATNGVANIRYTNAKNGTLSIYDISGKLVKTLSTEKEKGDETISINGLKSGVYIIQLKSDKGVAASKLIVK